MQVSEMGELGMETQRTFFLGLVCQHGSEGDVTDALDVLLRGGELVVDDNTAAVVHLDTSSLEVQAFSEWTASDGNEHDISLKLFSC
jgi:hypothetical protein